MTSSLFPLENSNFVFIQKFTTGPQHIFTAPISKIYSLLAYTLVISMVFCSFVCGFLKKYLNPLHWFSSKPNKDKSSLKWSGEKMLYNFDFQREQHFDLLKS